MDSAQTSHQQGARRRKSACERREQRLRSEGRMALRLVRALHAIHSHRGGSLGQLGTALLQVLSPEDHHGERHADQQNARTQGSDYHHADGVSTAAAASSDADGFSTAAAASLDADGYSAAAAASATTSTASAPVVGLAAAPSAVVPPCAVAPQLPLQRIPEVFDMTIEDDIDTDFAHDPLSDVVGPDGASGRAGRRLARQVSFHEAVVSPSMQRALVRAGLHPVNFVEMVTAQTGCTHAQAFTALNDSGGDLADAILAIQALMDGG